MEVHHHPDLHHNKKHWKEYFLEFLMIFLAVTLGFFAENMRENIADNQRGRQFIKSLAQDLRADTATLNGFIAGWSGQMVYEDSFVNLIRHNLGHLDPHEFYRQINFNMGYNPFQYHSRTIDQLKSSGSFRLIAKQSLSDSIMEYDNLVRNALLDVEKKLSDALDKQTTFQHQLIDYTAFPSADSLGYAAENHFKNLPDRLLVNVNDEVKLNEFLGILWDKRQLISAEIFLAKIVRENAISLLKQIEKEYPGG